MNDGLKTIMVVIGDQRVIWQALYVMWTSLV